MDSSKTLKIAIFSPFLMVFGGAERALIDIIQHLSKNNKVTLFYIWSKPAVLSKFSCDKVKLRLIIPNFFGYAISIFFTGLFAKFKGFDVVVNYSPNGNSISFRNKNVVWYAYSEYGSVWHFYEYYKNRQGWFKRLLFIIYAKFYRFFDKIMVKRIKRFYVISKHVQDRFKRFFGVDAEVLYMGVHNKEYYNKPAKKYFYLPGRIHHTKRIDIAINAVATVWKKYPDYKLIIAGTEDGHLETDRLKKLVSELGLENAVEFIGFVSDDDLKKYYSECLAVLSTSKSIELGLTILEAFSSGKPVITTNDGAPKEIVKDMKTGFVVEAKPDKFAEKMIYLIENKELCTNMKKNCLDEAKLFSINTVYAKLEKELIRFVNSL